MNSLLSLRSLTRLRNLALFCQFSFIGKLCGRDRRVSIPTCSLFVLLSHGMVVVLIQALTFAGPSTPRISSDSSGRPLPPAPLTFSRRTGMAWRDRGSVRPSVNLQTGARHAESLLYYAAEIAAVSTLIQSYCLPIRTVADQRERCPEKWMRIGKQRLAVIIAALASPWIATAIPSAYPGKSNPPSESNAKAKPRNRAVGPFGPSRHVTSTTFWLVPAYCGSSATPDTTCL
jgi:hypothetical protein